MQLESLGERCEHFSLKILTFGGTNFTIEQEQVLRTDLNNLEIRYQKIMYFPDRGVCTHPTHLVCLLHWPQVHRSDTHNNDAVNVIDRFVTKTAPARRLDYFSSCYSLNAGDRLTFERKFVPE